MTEWSRQLACEPATPVRIPAAMQTVTVIACTLWQGGINSLATSLMMTSDAETDVNTLPDEQHFYDDAL